MAPIDNTSLKSYLYNQIRDMISCGEFQIGEKINKSELAKRFDASQTPVNDALNRLVGEKYLSFESRKGYFVREYTIEEMIDFFELRAALEGMALRLCAENLEDEKIEEITSCFDGFTFPLPEEDKESYRKQDIKFHSMIVEYSNNQYIIEFMNSFGLLVKSHQKGLIRSTKETYPEHMLMIEALRKRDAERCQTLMNQHHLDTRDHLVEMLRKKELGVTE